MASCWIPIVIIIAAILIALWLLSRNQVEQTEGYYPYGYGYGYGYPYPGYIAYGGIGYGGIGTYPYYGGYVGYPGYIY